MADTSREDPIVAHMRHLKSDARKKAEAELSRMCEEEMKLGRYPWEGIWATPEDIRQLQRLMVKRDRAIFCEIILLFAGVVGFSLLVLSVLFILLPD